MDTNDCWLPTDEHPSPREAPQQKEQSPGGYAHKEVLLSGLNDMLKQHRQELGDLVSERIDRCLEQYHEKICRRLSMTSLNSALRLQTPLLQPQQEQEQPDHDPERHVHFEGAFTVEMSNSSNVSQDGENELEVIQTPTELSRDLMRCSFGQAEQHKQEKSRKVSEVTKMQTTIERASWSERRRDILRHYVEAQWFEAITAVLIVSNVCVMGFEVEFLYGLRQDEIPKVFQVVDNFYTFLFFLELSFRYLAFGMVQFCCGSNRVWNIIDIFLVLVAVIEALMDLLMEVNPKFEYLRVIRMARIVRILRVVRIMKFFRPMRILVYSVANTIRSLFWTLVLMAIIIYLFAVMFTTAASDRTEERDGGEDIVLLAKHFGSLSKSTLTLFKCITNGMDWEVAVQALYSLNVIWTILFVAYISITQLAVLNVVTGVVCQTAIESARQDQDIVVHSQLAVKQRYVEQLEDLFKNIDSDRTGFITLQEFEEHIKDEKDESLQDYFAAMDLTIDEAWNLFKLLDTHGVGKVDIDEFVSGCLKLRGTARSIDVHMLMYESKWTMKKLSKLMVYLESLRSNMNQRNGSGSALLGSSTQGLPTSSSILGAALGLGCPPTPELVQNLRKHHTVAARATPDPTLGDMLDSVPRSTSVMKTFSAGVF